MIQNIGKIDRLARVVRGPRLAFNADVHDKQLEVAWLGRYRSHHHGACALVSGLWCVGRQDLLDRKPPIERISDPHRAQRLTLESA
jgi:hypothetical protein